MTYPPSIADPTFVRAPLKWKPQDPVAIGLWIALIISCLLWAMPFVFMLLTAVKSAEDISGGSIWSLPERWEWGNFTDAAERGDLTTSFVNSLVVAAVKVPLGLFVSSACAFALSRIVFGWNKLLLAVIVMGAFVPIQVALGPLFSMMESLDLLNSRLGIVLPYIAFGLPFQTFFLYNFFSSIPRELDEAARIDGAGHFRIYFHIIAPLAGPALAALFIIDFVATWNEYAIALTLLQSQSAYTVPLALGNFSTQFASAYGPLNAYIAMSVLPVLIVYLMFQRFFTSGALAGAVKG